MIRRTISIALTVAFCQVAFVYAQTKEPENGPELVRLLQDEYGVMAGRNKDGDVYVAILNTADPPRELTEGDIRRIVDRLSRIETLQKLGLHHIDLNKELLGKLSKLPNLAQLSLSYSRFRDDDLEGLKGVRVTDVDLTGTPITDEGLTYLASLNKLGRLNISSTKVTGIGFKHLVSLPLRDMNLSATPLADESMKAIGKINSLQFLDLGHTPITDEGLLHLSGLFRLQQLNLDEARTTYAGRNWFREDYAESRSAAEKRGFIPDRHPQLVIIEN